MSGPSDDKPFGPEWLNPAVDELLSLLRKQPSLKAGWVALFMKCNQAGDISAALSFALASIPNIPNPEDVFLALGAGLYRNGMKDAGVAIFERILEFQPEARRTRTELIIHKQLYCLDQDEALREYGRWNELFVTPLLRRSTHARTSPEAARPLRIGFVSNDFGGDHTFHSQMAPWFLFQEKRSDTYVCYSNIRSVDPIHRFFLDHADEFVHVGQLSDEDLAAKIREDRIDILVDLINHGAYNRILTYARRPAPIIVAWIGIAMPIGVDAVDYMIADELLVPRESHGHYREKVVYLTGPAVTWCPPKSAPPVGPVPALRRGHVTFGSFTRIVKFGPETINLWSRVMRRVPDAKFMMKYRGLSGPNEKRVAAMFENEGIDRDRLIFKAGSNQREHMATYDEIDLVLDCYPQHGGMASCEALWMGVPVVTYCHPTKPSGRVGRFILDNIGLSSLVAQTEDDYVGIAEMLAQNPERLVPFRKNIRQRFASSPLCDAAGFQRCISAAFRQMWNRYCCGLKPESFTVNDA